MIGAGVWDAVGMYLHTYKRPPPPLPAANKASYSSNISPLRLEHWPVPKFQYGASRLLCPRIMNARNNRTVRRARNRRRNTSQIRKLAAGPACPGCPVPLPQALMPGMSQSPQPRSFSYPCKSNPVMARVRSGPPPRRPSLAWGPAAGGCSRITATSIY